jgi:hypothetical protein
MAPRDPYRLIEETAVLWRRRRLWNACLPALPPTAALIVAGSLGILPIELAAAAAIAFALLALHLTAVELSRAGAARFLDGALKAKDHFLTLATATPDASLLPVVAKEAEALAVAPPELPPRSRRPVLTSFIASLTGLLFLWWLPQVASFPAGGASDLDRIAAALDASGDASLATVVRDVARTLRDPGRSHQEKVAKIAEALHKIEEAERKDGQKKPGGSSGSGQGKRGQGKQEGEGGTEKGQGAGRSTNTAGSQGGAGGAGDARSQAKQELGKLAGQLSSGASEGKDQQQSQQGQSSQPAGGGIQGPESGANERKQSERDGTANQAGKNPNQSGGNEKTGGNQGAAQAEQGPQQNQPEEPNQSSRTNQGGPGAHAEGSGQRSTSQGDTKPADPYYKPGEGPDGKIADGEYVKVRVPEEDGQLPGTEIVAKPGDATPLTPYGNAPLPAAGSPGEVAADQPVPLEYREALKSTSR